MEPSVERRVAELTRECFQAQLGVTPQSVEVRTEGNVVVRVRGFLVRAEQAMMGYPEHRTLVEQYYLRLLNEAGPLLTAAVRRATGSDFVGIEIVPSLLEDECLFVLTLGVGTASSVRAVQSPDHRNSAGSMP